MDGDNPYPILYENEEDDPLIGRYYTDEEEEDYKPKKKKKSTRQLRHEKDLKARGKWKEPVPYNDAARYIPWFPNSTFVYQSAYTRQIRPRKGDLEFLVAHVESAREIYLVCCWDLDFVSGLTKELVQCYEGRQIPMLPSYLLQAGSACVMKHDGQWYRCRITKIAQYIGAYLFLSDFGKSVFLAPNEFHRLKVLLKTDVLDHHEMAYHCTIATLCEAPQSSAEKNLLKEFLPVGTKIRASVDLKSRKSVHPPWRFHLWYGESNADFSAMFQEELVKRGIPTDLFAVKKERRERARRQAEEREKKEAEAEARMLERMKRKDELEDDPDRDERLSVRDFTDEQRAIVTAWLTGEENFYPLEEPIVGITLEELKERENDHYYWVCLDDSGDSEDEYLDDWELLAKYRPELAKGASEHLICQ